MRLLYVTDRRIDAYLVKALREAGHLVETTRDSADGVVIASGDGFDAIVLDCFASLAETAAVFAAAAPSALVVLIVAAGQEVDAARLLEAGADACFARPAAFIELEERLKALRRLMERTRAPLTSGTIQMAPAIQAVRVNGWDIVLSRREFRLMTVLAARPGEVVGFDPLLRQIWDEDAEPRLDLLKACLARLRRKLDASASGAVLKLVSGHGYRLELPAASADAAPANMKIV